jgi:hypothetical protein
MDKGKGKMLLAPGAASGQLVTVAPGKGKPPVGSKRRQSDNGLARWIRCQHGPHCITMECEYYEALQRWEEQGADPSSKPRRNPQGKSYRMAAALTTYEEGFLGKCRHFVCPKLVPCKWIPFLRHAGITANSCVEMHPGLCLRSERKKWDWAPSFLYAYDQGWLAGVHRLMRNKLLEMASPGAHWSEVGVDTVSAASATVSAASVTVSQASATVSQASATVSAAWYSEC